MVSLSKTRSSLASRLFLALVASGDLSLLVIAWWVAISRISMMSAFDKHRRIDSLGIDGFGVRVFKAAGGHG